MGSERPDRRCARCGATGVNLRRVEDDVLLCHPDPVPTPPSCYLEWRATQGSDAVTRARNKAFALLGKLSMDDQDRHAFTLEVLKERGRNACSWSPAAPHPLSLRDFERINAALSGAVLYREMKLAAAAAEGETA